jgi:NadR type nicotinamide-nucleotide adenylyltransferase
MEKTDKTLIRIAIVGPESTGKTTLAEELAAHYNTAFVPEYARAYIDRLNRPYTIDDILAISKGQVALEDERAKLANKLLICDTNLLVTKIWAEHAYNYCPEWIVETIKTRTYHIYLLTYPDTPWVADEQREHPHLREFLFEKYKNELEKQAVAYSVITGLGKLRLDGAIDIINKALKAS